MFDEGALRDAEDMAQSFDEALSEGRSGELNGTPIGMRERELMAEREERRRKQQERQEMLLIERVIDELPDTAAYVRNRVVTHARDVVGKSVLRAGAHVVMKVESFAVRGVSKVVQHVYQERLDRAEAMARLGRRKDRRDPRGGSNERVYAKDAGAEAANDLFEHLATRIHVAFHRPRVWLARKLMGAERSKPQGEPYVEVP
jgi:hypothetical protein